jgi:hypothetical protein
VPREGGKLLTAYARLTDALRGIGSDVKESDQGKAMAQCPAHDDGKRSLAIGPRKDGKGVVLYCHAGCALAAVLAALSLYERDLFDDNEIRNAYRTRADYKYPDGRVVHRKPDKSFPQGGNTEGNALFRADRIGAAATVYVVEGEKDVLAIEAVGGVAVCSAMGAGKGHLADWSPLTGKNAVIVPDRDEPGRKHASQVADLLRPIAKSVVVVEAATGKDAADHIAADKTLDELVPAEASGPIDGAEVLERLERWFGRFIRVTDERDLALLGLWTVSTHLAVELYTSARLQVDSTLPGSGKTTVLDHFSRLCWRAVQAASLSSPALLPRLLENGVRTVLLDEVDRSLRPDRPGVQDLLGILNSGYRVGATRPVLVPVKGGGWDVSEMPTFAPVAMAGNSPNLPDDTRSRSLRILLMPDRDGSIEDSDWEFIGDEAAALHAEIVDFADTVRDRVKGLEVVLPARCIGRAKEKWRPLKRVAVAAGGRWPAVADALITRGLDEDDDERDAGLRTLPPGMVILSDLCEIWPPHDDLVPTRDLVSRLIAHNPDYWGERSAYGKPLTETRFGKLVAQASKVTSQRPGKRGPRGYFRPQLTAVWGRLGFLTNPPGEPGAPGEPGEPGAVVRQVHQPSQVHQVEPGSAPAEEPAHNGQHPATPEQQDAYRAGLCIDCHNRPPSAGRPRCDQCHRIQQTVIDGYAR